MWSLDEPRNSFSVEDDFRLLLAIDKRILRQQWRIAEWQRRCARRLSDRFTDKASLRIAVARVGAFTLVPPAPINLDSRSV
jgi:hypothetical protein